METPRCVCTYMHTPACCFFLPRTVAAMMWSNCCSSAPPLRASLRETSDWPNRHTYSTSNTHKHTTITTMHLRPISITMTMMGLIITRQEGSLIWSSWLTLSRDRHDHKYLQSTRHDHCDTGKQRKLLSLFLEEKGEEEGCGYRL